mgnify:CR=1 FL=1
MFALDIDLNLLLSVCVALGVLCLILLFVSARRKRDSLELQQDLNKNIEDFNRLLEISFLRHLPLCRLSSIPVYLKIL